MPLRAGIVAFVIVAMLLAVSPVFAEQLQAGTGPGDAIPLSGTQSGTLPTGGEKWYTFSDAGTNTTLGVVMNYTPAASETNLATGFEVWDYEKSGFNVAFTKIGMGTVGDLPVGVKYWAGGNVLARTYYVRVFNNAPNQVAYAIAFVGQTFPPPSLTIAPSGATGAPAGPTAPTPAPAAPTPVPTVPPSTPAGAGTSAANAIPLGSTALSGQLGAQSVWYSFFFAGNNEAGVVMNFQPVEVETATNNPNANIISFRVWAFVCPTTGGLGGCPLVQVGAGTRSGLPVGVKYWRTGGTTAKTFYIEVFNGSGQPAAYAISGLGKDFPPPGLVVPPVGAAPAPAAPAPAAPTPAPAAPTPAPAAPSAPTTGAGSSANNPIQLTGQVQSGRLTTQSVWYNFNFAGKGDEAIVMNFQPVSVETSTNNPNAEVVSFRVWTNVCTSGLPADQSCQLTQVGQGTSSNLPAGVKYWRAGGNGRSFLIEVFNASGQPVGYAIQNIGSGYPPPALPVPAP